MENNNKDFEEKADKMMVSVVKQAKEIGMTPLEFSEFCQHLALASLEALRACIDKCEDGE